MLSNLFYSPTTTECRIAIESHGKQLGTSALRPLDTACYEVTELLENAKKLDMNILFENFYGFLARCAVCRDDDIQQGNIPESICYDIHIVSA